MPDGCRRWLAFIGVPALLRRSGDVGSLLPPRCPRSKPRTPMSSAAPVRVGWRRGARDTGRVTRANPRWRETWNRSLVGGVCVTVKAMVRIGVGLAFCVVAAVGVQRLRAQLRAAAASSTTASTRGTPRGRGRGRLCGHRGRFRCLRRGGDRPGEYRWPTCATARGASTSSTDRSRVTRPRCATRRRRADWTRRSTMAGRVGDVHAA